MLKQRQETSFRTAEIFMIKAPAKDWFTTFRIPLEFRTQNSEF